MSTSQTLSEMYPPSVRPGTGIPLADFVRGMTYNASFVSDYASQSHSSSPPSISSASIHSSSTAPPDIMTASLPSPYASVVSNAGNASLPPVYASNTTPPSYRQLSYAPPGYATLDSNNQIQRMDQAPSSAQVQFRGGVPFQQQLFIPAGYTTFGQHPNSQYGHPSSQQAHPQARQPFAYAQTQGQQPSIQYQYPLQQQQVVYTPQALASQSYSLLPQTQSMNPYGQIQTSPNPCQPAVFLRRVVEEDSSEEDEKPPQRTSGSPLRGVRYHIGGR